MQRVILARLAAAIPLLLATSLFSFLLIHWAPGSFLDGLRLNPGISPRVIDELAHRYGLDRPWYEQYAAWLAGLTQGDMGPSLSFQRPVEDLLSDGVPRTLALAGFALGFCVVAGIALGLLCAVRLNGAWDRWCCRLALGLLSIHPIVLAIIALSFAAHTRLFPIGGGSSPGASSLPFWPWALDYARHFALPALVLTLFMLPGFFLQARGALADLLPSSFVRAGRSLGLREGTLLLHHALPAALAPTASFAASSIPRLLNGAFLVEVVTGWPGMGRLALAALRERDSFLLLGTLVVAAAVLLLGGLLADLFLARVDPRVRLEEAAR
jgi:peptide/nickel transport system permease protein